MTPSIRRQLLFILLPFAILIWLVSGLFSYFDLRNEIEQLADAKLVQSGEILLAQSLASQQQATPTQSPHLTTTIAEKFWQHNPKYNSPLAFQIWFKNDFLLFRSENSPLSQMTTQHQGLSDVLLSDTHWRIFATQSHNGLITIQIGENATRRGQLGHSIIMRIMMPFIFSLPLLAWLAWFSIGKSMTPLKVIASELHHRRTNDLYPVNDSLVPLEARTITDSINTLLSRLKSTIENERRFTADAAHELRTPLAALKTHAEVALQASTHEERQQALRQTVRGVNRATRLVEQLLTLARLDPSSGLTNKKRADLFILGESVLSEEAPVAFDKNIEISLHGTRGKFISGNIDAVRVLMRNLVDNAIRYTPDNGEVQVIVSRQEEQIILSVADSGPGIPVEDRERIFKRFFRRLGTKSSGSGLGLSIVSRIVDIHGLHIELSTAAIGGLQIDVTFPKTDE